MTAHRGWGARLVGPAWGLAGVAAFVQPAVVGPLAVVLLAALLVTVVRRPPPSGSRWRRGWWMVALAVGAAGLAWAPGIGTAAGPLVGMAPVGNPSVQPVGAGLGVAAGVALLLAVTVTPRWRDAARRRSIVVEATLAGLLVAYAAGMVLSLVPALPPPPGLAALAVEVAAFWALRWLLLHDGNLATRADRLLAVAALALVVARLTMLAAPAFAGDVPARSGAAATTVAVLACVAALRRPEVRDPAPPVIPTGDVLHPGHILLVVAGVLAGPAAAVLHLAVAGPDGVVAVVAGGGLVAVLAVAHLLQLVRYHGRRAWRAGHDALTGLPSEPLFEDRLEQAMARARRSGSGLAVAFVDLDDFKRVNDRDGHEVGDEVLRVVAQRLRDALREQDTVARKAGDEFLVLLPGVDAPADAEQVAAKLMTALTEPIGIRGQHHRIGASIGLAMWPRDGDSVDELIRHADAAMYEVKEATGGAVRWYTTRTSARARLRTTLAQQLELALVTGQQLHVAYQPRVDLDDGRVTGLVALVRWRHPDLGLLTPQSFLPIAGEAGLTREVDLHVLERACADLAVLHAEGLLSVPVAVHVSDDHTISSALEEDVVHTLRRTGLHPGALTLALTEEGVQRGADRLRRNLHDLDELGVGLLLSRFGTGPISLDALAGLPPATAELAPSHVASLRGSAVDAALSLAERFGLEVTANGVTGADQAVRLRELGCTTARGPYLGPPVLGESLAARLAVAAQDPAHDPGHVAVSRLLQAPPAALPERPELAAVLDAALQVDAEVEEDAFGDVLALLGGTDLPEAPAPDA